MTMRQIVKNFYPERISKTACGGVVGCPYWYGLEPHRPKNCQMSEKNCKKCWNRQFKANGES